MSKNKKPMTDAQREAKRARDAKYRAAKKAAKVAAEKKPVAKKPTAKKPEAKKVAKPVKTALPKVQTAEVEPVRIHTIRPGDVIRFEGFTDERVLDYANRLIMSVGYDRMAKMMSALHDKQKKVCPCKK